MISRQSENRQPPGAMAEPPPLPGGKQPVNVHRAFFKSACAPGWGEFYAGARIRGIVTALVFIFFMVWFGWTFIGVAQSTFGRMFDSLNSGTPFALPALPVYSLAMSFLGIYAVWLWTMISSVDVAMLAVEEQDGPPAASVGWAIALSWFCPGAGQIYTGYRRWGYLLFAANLAAILLLFPAYAQLGHSIAELAKSGRLSTNSPYALVDIVHGLFLRVQYGSGKLFGELVRYLAVAGALAGLISVHQEAAVKWRRPLASYALALAGIGWLCPGAGQILQARNRTGWYLLAAYLTVKCFIGLLLGAGLVTTKGADSLEWIHIIIQWAAMLEAPIWTTIHKHSQPPGMPPIPAP